MNHPKFHIILFLLFLFPVLSSPAMVEAASIKGASVTLYNSGRALVKETRTVTVPEGMAGIVFKAVPSTLDPTSVHAVAEGMTVHDVQYRYVPITTANLLDRYVGKEVTIIIPDQTSANGRIQRKATLLSNQAGPIFKIGTEVYAGAYDSILFPEVPGDLQSEPTLTLTTYNEAAAKRNVLLSYLMGGLNWRADYTLAVDDQGKSASLSAWATITNSSRRGFVNSTLKLVAGSVQRERPRAFAMAKNEGVESMAMDAPPGAPREESFSQFHLYSVDRPITLPDQGTKQISLFSAPKVAVKQHLASRFSGGRHLRKASTPQSVNLILTLENTLKNGLGRPMPGGLVRVFMPTEDGSQLLAGEARIGHTAQSATAELILGRSFDVTVERRQSEYKKIGENAYEMSWEISVLNGSGEAQSLRLSDAYGGEWQVLKANREFTIRDTSELEFALEVPPTPDGNPHRVNYTIQVRY